MALLAAASAAVILVWAPPLSAQGMDAASTDALAQTLRMLTDPAARGGAVAGGGDRAAEADRAVRRLAGSPELSQELYALAADVMAELVRGTGGDVGKMTAALEQARPDPAGFAAMLSPQTLARLRALAVKLSDAKR